MKDSVIFECLVSDYNPTDALDYQDLKLHFNYLLSCLEYDEAEFIIDYYCKGIRGRQLNARHGLNDNKATFKRKKVLEKLREHAKSISKGF
jgi:hypothetical protein